MTVSLVHLKSWPTNEASDHPSLSQTHQNCIQWMKLYITGLRLGLGADFVADLILQIIYICY